MKPFAGTEGEIPAERSPRRSPFADALLDALRMGVPGLTTADIVAPMAAAGIGSLLSDGNPSQ